jgi:hypothetical protein
MVDYLTEALAELNCWQDPITLQFFDWAVPALQFGAQRFELNAFLQYIRSVDLSIDIQCASEEEFVLSGLNDYLYCATANVDTAVNPLRLRNPLTNCGFKESELRYIWRVYCGA